ncbi:MAG: hypothetical protein OEM50_12245, partial [Gammaproteobacteria bacterium]|nr:hypothetical protein [Gammaproteobacteria bacterium]
MQSFKHSGSAARAISCFFLVSTWFAGASSIAQTEQPGSADAATTEALEEIVITGSYIKGSTTTGALPIAV